MRRSTILLSCARFIMLSLNGARQISGNKVRMSIFMGRDGSPEAPGLAENNQRRAIEVNRPTLLDDLERSALGVTRRGTVQHGADRVNRLAVATDDAANVALAELHFENRHFAVGNFRQHHVVRE